jgi:uncharacterized membrane protein
MKAKFGLAFLVIASLLAILQVMFFYNDTSLSTGNLLIVFLLTLGSVLGATLTYSRDVETYKQQKVGAIGLIVCIFLIIAMSYQILTSSGQTSASEFFILIIYALVFGFFGAKGAIGYILPPKFLVS